MNKLLILSEDASFYHQFIQEKRLSDLEIIATSDITEGKEKGQECNLVFGEPSLIQHVISDLPQVAWVQSTWAGVEPLLKPTMRRDYVLTNARPLFGPLISEYVFGYILAHTQGIDERRRAQQEHKWEATTPTTLRGQMMGIMGVGAIGAHLAQTAKYFRMKTKGYTRRSTDCKFIDQYFHSPHLLEFIADLDYLVCVLPNTPDNQNVINEMVLQALPNHALLFNVGRGTAIEDEALITALETDQLAGAVLDVFREEPLPAEHPFWDTPNLQITYHTAAISLPIDTAPIFVENYGKLLAGQPLKYQIDFAKGY